MKRVMCLFALAVSVLAISAWGAVPQQINYQGFLTNTSGLSLDTTVAMTFTLYDALSEGNVLWTETRPTVTVSKGLFNLRLGTVTTLPDSVFNRLQVWLGVAVGGDAEMTPRSRLVSVGFSYRVGTVDGASGGTISGKLNVGSGNTNSGSYANVFGENNNARGSHSVVCGGGGTTTADSNSASGDRSVVAGGFGNIAFGDQSAVAGGYGNRAAGATSTVGGGHDNSATYFGATISGGENNQATASDATVGGGEYNSATHVYTTVGGGSWNKATGYSGTVGGGMFNSARGDYSVVAGGGGNAMADSNSACGPYSVVGGGHGNLASGGSATVAGGAGNQATGGSATVGGGYDVKAISAGATASGGSHVYARGFCATVGGGGGGSLADSNSASGDYSAIGGGRMNAATNDHTTVGGGYYNNANASGATVGGGQGNTALDNLATVSGGYYNMASNNIATIGGGSSNEAAGYVSTIGGGDGNMAGGYVATVPGGEDNWAGGDYSFAAGRRAKANHIGAFVWADSYAGDFASSANDQFNVRASGGTRIYSNTGLTAGVTLAAGANAWVAVSDSTKKQNIRPVDTKNVLDRVAQLPIKQWSYKSQDPSIEHVGPMAQDFYKLFHLGEDSLGISTIDPDGIALAAIQELQKQNAELKKELNDLRSLVEKMAMQHDANSGKATSAAFTPQTHESTLKEITQ